MNEIRLKAYGFSMEAVGSKKFIAQEREAFLDFTEEKVSKAAMKLSGNDARAEVHSQEVRNRENAEHGEDLVTMTHKTTQPISLEWIQEVVRLGRARDYFSEGDTIDIEFDGEVIQHDIIGIDAEKLVDKSLEHSITIQMHDLVMEERPFDTTGDYGSNVWETFTGHNTLKEFFLGDKCYNAQKEDVEAAEKKMEGLSVLHKLLCMVSAMVADADLVDWNYTYSTGKGEKTKAFYKVLELYGFQYPNDEEKGVVEGTSDLYVKKEGAK